jgi:peptidyl-prolyl cis-trans isomerase D
MALKWMRDQFRHLKFVLWFVVFVFVALVFVDWGTGRSGSRQGGGDFAVRVGPAVMSEQEFLNQVSSMERTYSSQFGEQWEQLRQQVNLAEQVAGRFVSRELLAMEAERVGLVVTDEEVRDTIVGQFVDSDGNFMGAKEYEMRVRHFMRKSPREYEEELRRGLLVDKLRDMVQRGVYVSDAEAEEAYRREKETADFDAIQIRYEPYLDQVTVSEDEIQTYYDDHAADFHRAEQRRIRYLLVETSKLRRLLPVDDTEIEAFYEQHRQDFMNPEQAQARHILIQVPQGADATAAQDAKLRADAVAKMARDGADFAELAKVHSDDPATRDDGGDLGWIDRGSISSEELDAAIFDHKPGDVVGPVRSAFGFHVVKVEGYRSESVRPLDEVREEVRYKLLEGRAAAEAESRARSLATQVKASGFEGTQEAWQALADQDEAVVLNISPDFGKSEVIPGVGDDPDLVDEVFEAEDGAVGEPRAISRGWMVWQLDEIKPEGVPPLEEVRAEVEQDVQRTKALALASAEASRLAEAWRGGADAAGLAEQVNTTVAEARDQRRGAAVPGLGMASGLLKQVFEAEAGAVIGPIKLGDQAVVIARVDTLQLVDPAVMQGELDSVRTRLVRQRSSQLIESMLDELRRQTLIERDAQLIQRFAPSKES